jgi:hypothetical protein
LLLLTCNCTDRIGSCYCCRHRRRLCASTDDRTLHAVCPSLRRIEDTWTMQMLSMMMTQAYVCWCVFRALLDF